MIAIFCCHQDIYYHMLMIKFNPIQDGGVKTPRPASPPRLPYTSFFPVTCKLYKCWN